MPEELWEVRDTVQEAVINTTAKKKKCKKAKRLSEEVLQIAVKRREAKDKGEKEPTISYSVIPFSSCLQSFPASESLQMSKFLTSGGQRVGDSASISVIPMNIQD